jgi:WG containing repeat
MKFRFILPVLLFIACHNLKIKTIPKTDEPLFPIEKNGRWGFINRQGSVVVAPQFRDVGRISCGLAPARLNGSWGFIDLTGKFAIAPAYDFASYFSEGFAQVWKDGRLSIIDTNGRQRFALPDSIRDMEPFFNGKMKFSAMDNGAIKYLEVDTSGKISPIAETAFSEGFAVVKRGDDSEEYGIMDSAGKMAVPFGRYSSIDPFKNGYAQVTKELNNGTEYITGFLNKQCQEVFWLPLGEHVFDQYFSEGLIAVLRDTAYQPGFFTTTNQIVVWYDTTGKVVMTKPCDQSTMPFHKGRTFAGDIRNWYLMDKSGRQLSQNRFEWVNDFVDNKAIVAEIVYDESLPEVDRYGIIDTNGNYLVSPQFNHVSELGFQSEGLLVAMNEPLRPEHGSPEWAPIKKYWGLIDDRGRWLIRPTFTNISSSGFENGLLYVEIDSLYGYVNPQGSFVWQAIKPEQKTCTNLDPLNVDYMLRAYCYGFANKEAGVELDTRNINRASTGAATKGFLPQQFGITVNEQETECFKERFRGVSAYVFNTTTDTVNIDVQDNRLYIVVQALLENGEWKNIEYAPSSWCGNSYYQVSLSPDQFWKFVIPVYDGDKEYTLRLSFRYEKARWDMDNEADKIMYSNTFKGKINPAQFWRKQGYAPGSLMDPYWD